jgi:hypothetical protein
MELKSQLGGPAAFSSNKETPVPMKKKARRDLGPISTFYRKK